MEKASKDQPEKDTSPDEYDFVCVGFGVSGLSLAIALEEECPKAHGLFVERRLSRMWNDFPVIQGSQMQLSFLHDLVLHRNPRSRYSIVNFLHQTGKLLPFLNLSRLSLPRELMKQYLEWAASHFQDVVQYGQEAIAVEPDWVANGTVKRWRVLTKDCTGKVSQIRTKRVVSAIGAQPLKPSVGVIPHISSKRILHTSEFTEEKIRSILGDVRHTKVAIIGCDQAAAEIFSHMQSTHSQAELNWFIDDTAMRPQDDNPFAAEMLESPYRIPPELRKNFILSNRPDHSKAVSLELIENMYEKQIALDDRPNLNGIKGAEHKIIPTSRLLDCQLDSNGLVKLTIQDSQTNELWTPVNAFDLLIYATGYSRSTCKDLLRPLKALLQDQSCKDVTANIENMVEFRRNAVATSEGVGIWIIGGFDQGSDVNDEIFRLLGSRSGKLVSALKKSFEDERESSKKVENREMSQARL